MTPFALLLNLCGLSQREAAAFLNVRPDTVKSWGAGRNAAPVRVLDELRALHRQQRRAADKTLAQYRGMLAEHGPPEIIDLALAANDEAAKARGWPCIGAHAAVLGLVIAAIDGQRFSVGISD
jgi:hypothetical protein